jgi:alpha-glucosidase
LHKEGKYETNYTKYKINLIDFLQVKSIEIDNEEVSFDSMKLEEANYFIVAKEFNVLHIIGE